MWTQTIAALSLWAVLAAAKPQLVKVIGLGRHGNREANAEVDTLCPKARAYIPWVGDANRWEAQLTTTGELQCMMAGHFLHHRYVVELGHLNSHPADDDTTFFYADAADRNVACLDIAKRSMFLGPRAGDWNLNSSRHHSQVIPVVTTKHGDDTVMRLPKSYQCVKKAKSDATAYGMTHELLSKQKHRNLLTKLSDVCGFDFSKLICGDKEQGIYGGKCLSWGIKNVNDAIGFAKYEGYDWTFGGQISDAEREELEQLAAHLITTEKLRLDSQITYTVGDFPTKVLFSNMKKPEPGQVTLTNELQGIDIDKAAHPWDPTPLEFYYHNKFLLFWNHRELITGLLYMFSGVDKSGQQIYPFPRTGAMILWELWEDEEGLFVRYFTWELNPDPTSFSNRSLPWPHLKPKAFRAINELSTLTEVFPPFCKVPGRCILEEFEAAYDAWTQKTGTWQEICDFEQCESKELATAHAELAALRASYAELTEVSKQSAGGYSYGCVLVICVAVSVVSLVTAATAAWRARREVNLETAYLGISG